MENFATPFAIYLTAAIAAGLLAVALPFALWYYFRAKEIAPLLTKKAALEVVIENLNKDIHAARESLDNLTEDIVKARELVTQGEMAKKWLDEKRQEIEDLRIQVVKAREEFEGSKAQLDDLKEKVSSKQTELAELNTKLLAAEERFAALEKGYQENVAKLEQARDELKRDVSQLGADKAALQSEKEGLSRQVAGLKDERVELRREVEKLDQEIGLKREALKDLVESKNREIEAEIARKRKAVDDEIAGRRQNLERELQARREAFARDLANQTKQLEAMRAKQIDELRKEIDELKRQKDKMAAEVAEYEVRKQKNEDLKIENGKLEARLDGLRQGIADAESVIAKANTIRNNEANMWKDLERPVAIIEKKPMSATVVSDEEQALKSFKNALDESGYAFNERTIKAFHTGLLCGGVSPLVVLSGISGTGKSLLPELYAKAFNMNFLPVAVQPRWDGPQDVFGFYNHMEGRFKATELSRLLWQFDVYNNENAARMYGPLDQDQFPMNLVLLDEMNLARVEYYFSELLSKLEIRNRVIDPSLDDSRKPSEIELEYGASSVVDEAVARAMARRLFVGRNILFVGTMNEDESTQTLSSKVIDRSNVLRFGTPESLANAPDAKKFLKSCKDFVSYKTWQDWAKPFGSGLQGIDDAIHELKEALKRVDRGFGHRTESAIKQYVDFYPGNKQDALADQIEMKILPKLNGVEADLVRDKVQAPIVGVLHSIKDTDVTDALAATLQGESTFFTWKGVRR